MSASLVFDSRWTGPHGIGRFAREVRARLSGPVVDVSGAHPVSARGLLESEVLPHLATRQQASATYFSPGYTPCLTWRGKHAFTIHDLIHLDVESERSRAKELYYQGIVRRAVRRTRGAVLTVSPFSQRRIAEWADVPASRICVVGNGVSEAFTPDGPRNEADRPYVLHVGNTKPHKNLDRLVRTVAELDDIQLICSSAPNNGLVRLAQELGCEDRLRFLDGIDEADLPAWYRGASAVVIPSLYEGFGLPALEGMASGVPVVASATTALGELVGDAGVLVDPEDIDSIALGIEVALRDSLLRQQLARSGPQRAAEFRWDAVASAVSNAIASAER